MINFVDYVNENNGIVFKTEHTPTCPYISDHPYRILIIRGSGIWKNKCIIEFNKQPTRY